MRKRHYVNNKSLYECILVFHEDLKKAKENGEQKPKVPRYAAECIFSIANNLAKKHNFSRYPFKDEMIADAIENCVRYFDRFDPVKYKNPFAYFTQIIKFAFIRRIKREKKELLGKKKIADKAYIDSSMATQQPGDHNVYSLPHTMDTEYMNDFLESFENSERLKNEFDRTETDTKDIEQTGANSGTDS